MKISRILPWFLLPFLTACAPTRPELPAPEVPADPLLRLLEERSSAFLSLRATASANAYRKGRMIGLENVGVLVRSRERFRVDAYGPLGQPFLEVAWNGSDVQVRQYGGPVLLKPGGGLERYLGADVEPGEFCAILTGNAPIVKNDPETRAFCDAEECVLVQDRHGLVRRVRLEPPSGISDGVHPESYELLRSGTLLFRVLFEEWTAIANYAVPRKVVIESPERGSGLTILYEDIELNADMADEAFTLPVGEDEGR